MESLDCSSSWMFTTLSETFYLNCICIESNQRLSAQLLTAKVTPIFPSNATNFHMLFHPRIHFGWVKSNHFTSLHCRSIIRNTTQRMILYSCSLFSSPSAYQITSIKVIPTWHMVWDMQSENATVNSLVQPTKKERQEETEWEEKGICERISYSWSRSYIHYNRTYHIRNVMKYDAAIANWYPVSCYIAYT